MIYAIERLTAKVPSKFIGLSADTINYKTSPMRWSKKEILGHLCDSCFNNLQRVVRVQYENKPFIIYNQDEWVKNQNYQEREIGEVLDLWKALHMQFAHALKKFPENRLDQPIDIGNEVTALFVITDYLDHHNHHLKQIFEDW